MLYYVVVGVILLMEGEKGRTVREIMQRLLEENRNDADIKRQLRARTDNAERHTYAALTGSEEEYLQTYGLTHHEEEHFNYINMILHERTVQFLERIAESGVQVRSTLPAPPPPPPQPSRELVAEVEEVLRNVDLPLSLFKRQDHYWSQDNAKTVQVKEYIKELHEKDRQWKGELKRRRQEILNEKNEEYHRSIEEQAKGEQRAREEEKLRMARKIEQIRSMGEARKRTIEESLDFMKKQGRPLFKKMEEEFYNRVELPSLEEKKRKLSEVRELRRSVDLQEIQQHREKYDKIREEHEGVKIHNEPVKVSFKGEFHRSIEKSSLTEMSESRSKSLVDRRLEYAQMIKENFKPRVDEEKAAEVAERVESMRKRFTRAKNKFQRSAKGEEDEDEEEEEEEEEPEPEPQPEEEDEEDEEEEDEFKINMPKDDQYQPSHEERYKMGLKYLEIAKAKRRAQREREEAKAPGESSQLQPSSAPAVPSNESARKIKYRNYLHEMSRASKTIDFIDTSRMRSEVTADLHMKNREKVEEISNRIRSVQEKARQEEELLRFKKVRRQQAIDKKLQLDGALIDTIKVRLAMMNN